VPRRPSGRGWGGGGSRRRRAQPTRREQHHPPTHLSEGDLKRCVAFRNDAYFDPNDASLLHGTVQSRTGVRQGDPLGPLLFNLAINTPRRNIEERCRDSAAIQAFSNDGKYLIKTPFVPRRLRWLRRNWGKSARIFNQSNLRAWYLRIRPLNLFR
jgi:hypothetical protein